MDDDIGDLQMDLLAQFDNLSPEDEERIGAARDQLWWVLNTLTDKVPMKDELTDEEITGMWMLAKSALMLRNTVRFIAMEANGIDVPSPSELKAQRASTVH